MKFFTKSNITLFLSTSSIILVPTYTLSCANNKGFKIYIEEIKKASQIVDEYKKNNKLSHDLHASLAFYEKYIFYNKNHAPAVHENDAVFKIAGEFFKALNKTFEQWIDAELNNKNIDESAKIFDEKPDENITNRHTWKAILDNANSQKNNKESLYDKVVEYAKNMKNNKQKTDA
ncbi:hypothetical protein [Mycoplasmopsis opalescens]|uniref:hypothetical protein n=1 Tax=Mycoplasmopsis opalescens TaxID=114886 RepID=UPI0004A6E748|nr:hypothetical protein [Mycoplasmopsis opalescens]